MTIKIFSAEREAGLEELIRANASIALLADAAIAEPFEVSEKAKSYFLATAENKGQIDLHYIKTVMVSTGWNKNDDVFDPAEMWNARHSPEDKPFNFEHNQADIIGHITGSQAVDVDLKPIPETTPVAELPSPYHILTTAVLYKIWEDPERQARMDRLTAEISRGGWFVSMEALFHGFDYSIKTDQGRRVVARNEKTAFLTKHLRAYGGNGTYEGAQIGRVLRKIVFSGKGLVKKPANPDSVILETTNASGYELPREESLTMNEEIKTAEAELAAANQRAAKLEGELAASAAELNALKAAQRQSALKANANESLGGGSDAIAEALAHLNDDQFAIALAAVNDYLAAKLAAYKEAEQRAQTAESLKASVEEMKSILQQIKEAVNKEEHMGEVEGKANTSVKKMALPKKAPPPEAANVVTGGILNNVIPSEEPALADAAADQSVNKVAAQIAAFFGADDETEEPAAE